MARRSLLFIEAGRYGMVMRSGCRRLYDVFGCYHVTCFGYYLGCRRNVYDNVKWRYISPEGAFTVELTTDGTSTSGMAGGGAWAAE